LWDHAATGSHTPLQVVAVWGPRNIPELEARRKFTPAGLRFLLPAERFTGHTAMGDELPFPGDKRRPAAALQTL